MGTELTKSKYHADFIHDIIKKEYQADALYSLARECQNKAESIRREGNLHLEKAKQSLHQKEGELKEAKRKIYMRENDLMSITKYKKEDGSYPIEYEPIYETKYRKNLQSFFSFGRLTVIILMSFLVSLPLTVWMMYSVISKYSTFGEFLLLFIGGLLGFTLLLTLIINTVYNLIVPGQEEKYIVETGKADKFKNYPSKEKMAIHDLEYAKQYYVEIENQLSIVQTRYESALANQPICEEKARIMDNRANHLKKSADRLKSDQQKMFDMNVIPPDYRDLKCLFELYRIFYNNLADTMREAVMIYEDRVFKGIIIKGMCEFNNKLGLISEYIMDVKDELRSIGRDIDFMGGEIHRIRENQDDQSDKQDQMIEEMRATRYANEAVQESQERCEWYMHHDFWFK